jgi:asparagine synthase (glutamine-hydrolysing)
VTKLIKDNKQGKIDASFTIWSLLAIESWMTQFKDGKKIG